MIWFIFILYIVLSSYLLWRIIHWLRHVSSLFKHKKIQVIAIAVYCVLANSIIIGGLFPTSDFQVFMHKLGNYWLGVFIYLLFFVIVTDIIVVVLRLINHRYDMPAMHNLKRYYDVGIIILMASILFSSYGFLHAKKLTTKSYDITVNKQTNGQEDLNIVLVADLHLGYNAGCDMMEKMVNQINEMDPDVVVLAGDIFDNNYDALDDPDSLVGIFSSIQSRYGVYAVYGNHDVTETLVGGFSVTKSINALRDPRMNQLLENSGIKLLSDEVTTIADGSIYLVGRLDKSKPGDGTKNRKSIQELTENLDQSKPIILIEHQPVKLKQASDQGVDIRLSGHTHNGQFFPLNLPQFVWWDNFYGKKQVGNMYSFVTSGVGAYGPYMRVMSDAEVMQIRVKFQN